MKKIIRNTKGSFGLLVCIGVLIILILVSICAYMSWIPGDRYQYSATIPTKEGATNYKIYFSGIPAYPIQSAEYIDEMQSVTGNSTTITFTVISRGEPFSMIGRPTVLCVTWYTDTEDGAYHWKDLGTDNLELDLHYGRID